MPSDGWKTESESDAPALARCALLHNAPRQRRNIAIETIGPDLQYQVHSGTSEHGSSSQPRSVARSHCASARLIHSLSERMEENP